MLKSFIVTICLESRIDVAAAAGGEAMAVRRGLRRYCGEPAKAV